MKDATNKSSNTLNLPSLPILSPTALCGDAGDGKAYLRWNPQLEDERVIGWKVIQLYPDKRILTDGFLTISNQIIDGLTNGIEYQFCVVGVLNDGSLTPQSNAINIIPQNIGTAKVEHLERNTELGFDRHGNIKIGYNAEKIIFPDGQELIFDNFRPIDWKTRNGEHLIYPKRFGNGLDIGKFDNRGLPVIIPPEGLKDYKDAQNGTLHPYITDPYTLPMDREWHDAQSRWFEPEVNGNRVTLHYWVPLLAMGYIAWNYVLVWETWFPIERDKHGCKYHGFGRLIEVQMPDALKDGYQVMLNNGFGPNYGSRESVISYSSGFRRPTHEVVDFSGDKNRQVYFQSPKPVRRGGQYHPTQDCLQSSPLIFYDWGKGSLTVTARSLYYHCVNNSSSYIEQDADGVYPNLAWDMAISGERTTVDTVEYLYTSDVSQPLPQRYMNARFEALSDVSKRYDLQDTIPAVTVNGTLGQVKRNGGPLAHAEKEIKRFENEGIKDAYIYHDFWHAVPMTVDDAYRLDENHDCNPELKAMCDKFHEAGMGVGFWYRPEFVKTSIVNALSRTIPTAERYYGYKHCDYPNVAELLNKNGMPIFRENTHWVRKHRDGSYPFSTPYNWVPMSMASEWWHRIMYPTLLMSKKLGFDWILMDGGFAGLQGVDYAPMLAGKSESAVACQPYWWRMFRTMKHIGIKQFGECTVGWKGGFVNLTGEGDEHYLWMYQASCLWGNDSLLKPEQVHKIFQLYNGIGISRELDKAVCKYAMKFYQKHKAPDWIELKELKQGDEIEATVNVAESPVAGGPSKITEEDKFTFMVKPWTWTDVIWHYDDGTSVVYPAYDRIDWDKI